MLYADDLAIYYSAREMEEIEQHLQTALNTLSDTTARNGFRFSIAKTHVVHFCRLRREHHHPTLSLSGLPLECKSSTKFLGVILDQKLNWKDHIQDLANRCKKALNIIKCVGGIRWGAERDMLLRMYETLVLAKIDYGCIIYSSARKSHLKILDSIHNTGLRTALGAFRTSPALALCCEAGIPPLKYRRQQYLLSYGVNIWAQPKHPNFKLIHQVETSHRYNTRPTITRPTGVRFYELLNALEENLPQVYAVGQNEVPPWKLLPLEIIIDQPSQKKNESVKQDLRNTFYYSINSFRHFCKIYTDGSKLNRGVGCAFVDGMDTFAWTLPKSASIFTAELYAIWQAMRYIDMSNINDALICTDSRSALEELSNAYTKDSLAQNILAHCHWLQSQGRKIAFVWTPSHVAVLGNEVADKAAKQAAADTIIDNVPIRKDDLKLYFKTKIMDSWQRAWDNADTKLKEVKPSINKWKMGHSLKRREECVIARLRVGHTNLTNIYLLAGEQPPMCQECEVVLSVKHILLQCPQYEHRRRAICVPRNLRSCLGECNSNLEKVLTFLKDIKLFTKL